MRWDEGKKPDIKSRDMFKRRVEMAWKRDARAETRPSADSVLIRRLTSVRFCPGQLLSVAASLNSAVRCVFWSGCCVALSCTEDERERKRTRRCYIAAQREQISRDVRHCPSAQRRLFPSSKPFFFFLQITTIQ